MKSLGQVSRTSCPITTIITPDTITQSYTRTRKRNTITTTKTPLPTHLQDGVQLLWALLQIVISDLDQQLARRSPPRRPGVLAGRARAHCMHRRLTSRYFLCHLGWGGRVRESGSDCCKRGFSSAEFTVQFAYLFGIYGTDTPCGTAPALSNLAALF